MALIKCADCGREISDRAKACIHCGCPIAVSVQKPEPAAAQKAAARTDNGPRSLSVDFNAVIHSTGSGHSQQKVFVKQLGRNVEFPIDNNTKAGDTIRVNLREGGAFEYILFTATSVSGPGRAAPAANNRTDVNPEEVLGQFFTSANKPAPAAFAEPASRPAIADLDKKIRELKLRAYTVPVIRLLFNLYFICSFVGLYVSMYLYPDGGAPELLMNVIAFGFTVGFIPVFYFNFLPYILAFYPAPGFFKVRKMMKNLEKRNLLEKAVTEMETCELVPFGDKMRLTDNFLISKKKNGIIIPCDELLWAYCSYSNRRGNGYLMLGTEKWGLKCYSRISGRRNVEQAGPVAIQALRRRNPSILVGETRENRKKYFKELKK